MLRHGMLLRMYMFYTNHEQLVSSIKQFLPIDLLPHCFVYPISFVDDTKFRLQGATSHDGVLEEVLKYKDTLSL